MKYYVVPEDYIKSLLRDSKMLECLDCSDYKLIKHECDYDEMLEEKESYINDCSELSEFSCIESLDVESYKDEDEESLDDKLSKKYKSLEEMTNWIKNSSSEEFMSTFNKLGDDYNGPTVEDFLSLNCMHSMSRDDFSLDDFLENTEDYEPVNPEDYEDDE